MVSRRVLSSTSVRSGELTLAAYAAGDPGRPTVLLIHGYPDTHDVWTDVVDRLAERWHVVTYDVRGAGASDHPRAEEAYDLTHLVSDALAVIDALAPGKAVHVVGHDWGSIQGWEVVTSPRTRGRVLSWTSLSGPCLDHIGHLLRDRRRSTVPGMLRQASKSWYVAALAVPGAPELAWRFAGPRWPQIMARREGVTGLEPSSSQRSDGVHGARLYRRNIPRRFRHPRADAVAPVPVQLVELARDHYVTPALLRDVERWAPSLRREQLDAGHWAPRTHPDAIAGLIDQFVSDVEEGHITMPEAPAPQGRTSPLVLVTGAGSGIGRETAKAFADDGATVLALDRDVDTARETVATIEGRGGIAHAYAVDVSDAAAMGELAAKLIAEHGVPDVLVNNAGIGISGSFFDTSLEDWDRVLGINLYGVIHGCRLFGQAMAERGSGAIVNVASAAAFQPTRELPAYSTSKAAVLMLSECLQTELAGRGVTVSAICPGIVRTNITRTTSFVGLSAEDEQATQERITRLYGRRNYGPEKVAKAIVRAARTGTAVVPVTPEAHVLRGLSRLSPAALRALGRLQITKR